MANATLKSTPEKRVFIGAFIDRRLAERFTRLAERTERGNVSALLEKTLAAGVKHRRAK